MPLVSQSLSNAQGHSVVLDSPRASVHSAASAARALCKTLPFLNQSFTHAAVVIDSRARLLVPTKELVNLSLHVVNELIRVPSLAQQIEEEASYLAQHALDESFTLAEQDPKFLTRPRIQYLLDQHSSLRENLSQARFLCSLLANKSSFLAAYLREALASRDALRANEYFDILAQPLSENAFQREESALRKLSSEWPSSFGEHAFALPAGELLSHLSPHQRKALEEHSLEWSHLQLTGKDMRLEALVQRARDLPLEHARKELEQKRVQKAYVTHEMRMDERTRTLFEFFSECSLLEAECENALLALEMQSSRLLKETSDRTGFSLARVRALLPSEASSLLQGKEPSLDAVDARLRECVVYADRTSVRALAGAQAVEARIFLEQR